MTGQGGREKGQRAVSLGEQSGSNTSLILRAAKRLFLERGFDGVNLDRVGKAAGVTRQTVYNLFGSKEAVFRSMVELHWATIADDLGSILVESADPSLNATAVLQQFGEAIVRFVAETEQIAFTRLVIAESRERPWIAEDFFRLGKQPLLNGLVVCIERLRDAGHLDCPQPLIAANQFFGMIQEMVIWPYVMAIGPSLNDLPSSSEVIDEAVRTFVSRFGVAQRHGLG